MPRKEKRFTVVRSQGFVNAVAEMQSVAQQNAGLVESMSQASDQLRAQGAQLMTAVDLFQLGGDELALSPSRG